MYICIADLLQLNIRVDFNWTEIGTTGAGLLSG